MARPNFSVDIASPVQFKSNGSTVWDVPVMDARHSEETQSGVSRRKPAGWLEPTGYNFLHLDYQRAMGSSKFVNPFAGYNEYTGCIGESGFGRFNSLNHFDEISSEGGLTTPGLVDQCLIAARIKLKRSSVNLGVAFAERGQTARLVGDTATALARSFTSLRRGQVRNAMNALGISHKRSEPRGSNVPGKWLELQYGWKPLLSDVNGACEALEKLPGSDWRVTAKSSRKATITKTRTFTGVESGLGVGVGETSVFVRIDALPGNELLGSLASLGVTNPLLIAWELVPYSFVVDWFLPVGKWLESVDALLGYESAYTSVSQLFRGKWQGVGTHYDFGGGLYMDNSYNESKNIVRLQRSASSGVPLPTFPRIKDPRSLGHMANGLALLASAFRR